MKGQTLGQIENPPWKDHAGLRALMAAGVELRLVGGCVRNALLGVPPGDFDLATPCTPDQVTDILTSAGIKVVPTGIDYGTVTAVVDGQGFEITSLREDVETDGRRAVVSYTKDWAVDAQRRDFTMNALYADLDGTVYDYVNGVEDLQKGVVRFVGNAATRIQEDYLRILRFFRFYAFYGKGAAVDGALDACQKFAPRLKDISGERISQEMKKLLLAPRAADVLAMMAECGVLAQIMSGARGIEKISLLPSDAILRLAVMVGVDDAHAIAGRWCLSHKDRDRLMDLVTLSVPVDDDEFILFLYRQGVAMVRDLLLLARVQNELPPNFCDEKLLYLRDVKIPTFPLTGDDVMARGVGQGKDVGVYLKQVEDWWVSLHFAPSREACLIRLEQMMDAACA